jgi:predicted DNA-binding transcriptional regulator
MSRDQAVGAILCIGSLIGILAYGWLVFASEWAMLVLQLTGFIAVGAVLGILAWIGYTLATTPPPKPIEDVEKEIEKAEEKPEDREGSS